MALEIGVVGEELNLRIRQGATFGPYEFVMQNPDTTPVDLTGCTIRGQIRRDANSTVALTLTVPITDAANGEYELSLTDEQTAGLRAGKTEASSDSRYVWDLELLDAGGAVTPLYYGIVTVLREVTR